MGRKGAKAHYANVMTLQGIKDYPLPRLDKHAVLFLWTVESMPEEAYEVARAWGFRPKTSMVWVKKTTLGNRHFGNGHYVRGEHERCIIATRGSCLPMVRDERSVFDAQVGRRGVKTEYTAKPDEFYAKVLRMYPMTKLGTHHELFARKRRAGWVQQGNELEKE
jgi:N6-adenosine-specific RNA methylase IME4